MIKQPNKHELRTKETRTLLLQAAETIFVRDGYEGAELGEIAALAGRTKGAIYAQFKSKEDVFLALIEEKTKRRRAKMKELLAESSSQEENLAIFRKYCLNLSEDQTWALLLLEFKLYALRHPESRARLEKSYDDIIPGNPEKVLVQLLGSAGKGPNALKRSVAAYAILPLLQALAVEAQFVPSLLVETQVEKVAARVFDALLPLREKK